MIEVKCDECGKLIENRIPTAALTLNEIQGDKVLAAEIIFCSIDCLKKFSSGIEVKAEKGVNDGKDSK